MNKYVSRFETLRRSNLRLWRREVLHTFADVSEEHMASILKVKRYWTQCHNREINMARILKVLAFKLWFILRCVL